jgi:hypothetical protein
MPKTGSFIHTIVHSGLSLNASTTYGTGRRHNLNLMEDTAPGATVPFSGRIDNVVIHTNTIAGGATSLTVRATSDAAGDNTIFGDTTATISTGVTTATEGCVTIKFDALWGSSTDNLYLFWKTNAGTAVVDTITVNWQE